MVASGDSRSIQFFAGRPETPRQLTLRGIAGGMAEFFQVTFRNIDTGTFEWTLNTRGDGAGAIRRQRCHR